MSKKEKVNWIKCWLQMFGERDNETFNTEVSVYLGNEITNWEIILQYNYSLDGDQLDPTDWCRNGFKHLRNNAISDRTEEELEAIIEQLKKKQLYH